MARKFRENQFVDTINYFTLFLIALIPSLATDWLESVPFYIAKVLSGCHFLKELILYGFTAHKINAKDEKPFLYQIWIPRGNTKIVALEERDVT